MHTGRSAVQLPTLTSLRFWAAAVVVAFHIGERFVGLRPVLVPAQHGYVGASFFFVLSGFVLTWTWAPGTRRRDFYLRRFARVFPTHLLLVAVAAVALHGRATTTLAALPANVSLTQAWFFDPSVVFSFVGPAWSLSAEACFYALFPLWVRWAMGWRRPLAVATAVVAVLMAVGAPVHAVSVQGAAYLYHLPAFGRAST